jgi:hypothetical protein
MDDKRRSKAGGPAGKVIRLWWRESYLREAVGHV